MNATTMLSFYDQRRLSSRYWTVFGLLCAALALDFFDFFIVGFLVASISSSWQLTYLQSSIMLLAGGLGGLVGGLGFGALGDRLGRKPMLILATATCGIGAGALALVPQGNWQLFSLLRLLVGAGLGGVGTLQLVLLVELTPTPKRVGLMGWPVLVPSLGTMLAAGAAQSFIEVVGWRGLAALGILPLLFCVPFALLIPEYPRWLLTRGRAREARQSIARVAGCGVSEVPEGGDVIASPPSSSPLELLRRPGRALLIALVFLAIGTANYGVYLWGPTIISMIMEIPVAQASKYFIWIALSGIVGRILFSILPARIGRVWSGRLVGFGIAGCLAIAGVFHDHFVFGMPVFVVALAFGALFFDGGFSTLVPYTAEIFSTRLAARGAGLAQSSNGLGKILGPLFLALIAGSQDYVTAKATQAAVQPGFLFLAACGLLMAICFFFAPETRDVAVAMDEEELEPIPHPGTSTSWSQQ